MVSGLDRARPYRAHTRDRFRRLHAEFDQKPRRYRAGTSKSSAAMDQHVKPTAAGARELFTGDIPLLLKLLVWN